MVSALVPVLAGLASAAPAPATVSGSASAAWAYGGQNSTNGTYTVGNTTVSWSASLEVAVLFNTTNTTPDTTELSAERAVSLTLTASASSNLYTGSYSLSELEVDHAYANVTNDSTVYVSGSPVVALGIDNASADSHSSIAESLSISTVAGTLLEGRTLNVSSTDQESVQFSPSLGLVPLNLTGVTSWNSSATATPDASWNVNYSWSEFALGTSTNGSGNPSFSWTATAGISLTGAARTLVPPVFSDHKARISIVLVISGPIRLYDGFIVIPAGFDIFSGTAQPYARDSFAAAELSTEGLYVTEGTVTARSFSAANMNFDESTSASTGVGTSGGSDPSGGVVAQPESPSTAQTQIGCMENGCSASPAGWFSGLVAVGLIAVVAAVVVSVGVIEWRSRSRGKTPPKLAGTVGGNGAYGIPSGASGSSASAPPAQSPVTPGGPG
jgi:hypothetical protein